ncbi:TMV resistance protein N-like [Neltuma alba]|uniref:TMV resistance protein N-like n=1 Tax=Neltuma alba TaxID=207710 RepID=UPI0010A3AB9C|nr:TMV resistance protein N-like [Prosopis alba]
MAQPAVSSCIDYKWKYDVFPSFHGEDTRLSFVSFLRGSLHERGIRVFMDDEHIRTGEEITPALIKAIRESRIAIIVFSENYANSTFCLQELVEILECFKEEGRLIYPVFYYVDPSELRRPRASYAEALARLEKRFKDNKQQVENWRLALSQAANLKGCHLKAKIANEQEHITEITNEVSARIHRIHNHLHIEGDQVLMHDVIEDMGKEIVRQESPDEPGKRSRLWFYQDILHVLNRNTGTNKVGVIFLDLPEDFSEDNEVQMQWSGKAFMKMTNLKILVIKNASFISKCPTHLPKSLKWLKWKGYPFKFLPHNICSTELICLDLSNSCFDTLQPFTKKFHTLSRMNFRNCQFLQQIPDLSGVFNLRELWLDDCTNLVEIHHSVGCLNKLKELSAMRCNSLEILLPDLRLVSLENLNLYGCSRLYSFPEILIEMKYMRNLHLGRTAIIVLPSSICNLIGLETLNIEECPYLEQLPTTICLLPNLWELNATSSKVLSHIKMYKEGQEENLDCYALSLKLERFCFSKCNLSDDSLALCLSHFTNMIHLDISFSSRVTTLPACIKECHHLKYLSLDHCNRLQHIEEMPPNLEKFSAICCMSLTKRSESRVLYQVLNLQPGKTNFIFPGGKFPENLDSYSRRSCVSFWVRDVFPTIFIWILVKQDQDFLFSCSFLVHVNDVKLDISSEWLLFPSRAMPKK